MHRSCSFAESVDPHEHPGPTKPRSSAVDNVIKVMRELLESLVPAEPPRNRGVEPANVRATTAQCFFTTTSSSTVKSIDA